MDSKILLCKIKEIRQYKLILSLPHNRTGVCELNEVSEQYSKLLAAMAKHDENEELSEDVPSLSDLFVVGQTVQGKMKKTKGNRTNVTLIPSDVNADINIKHIKSGMRLQVAIQSCEDKGYILESGISGLNGFLPFDKCDKQKYHIGQLLEAFPIVAGARKKTESNSRVINFTTESKLMLSPLASSNLIEFSCIVPGTLINTHLKLAANGNMEGTFQGFPVTVKPDHQLIVELKSPDQVACVIGVDNAMKLLDCSLLPHLLKPSIKNNDLSLVKIGHSEPNCTVEKVQKHQMTFSLPHSKTTKAVVKIEQVDPELKGLKVGESTTIRFLDFNLMDNVVLATCLKKLLALSYFSVNQAKLGEIVKGTVKGYQKIGFAVQISSTLSGFIPVLHLKDSQVKVPASVYKSGEEIKCRVFHIDHAKNKLVLTVKKSFMNSKLPVAESVNDLIPGILYDGFVAKIYEFGLLVVMFNNLKGWIRKSEIKNANNIDLNVMFHKGQPVQARFLKSDKSGEKISFSLLESNDEEDKPEKIVKDGVKVDVGQIFECVVKKVMKNGFNVRLMPINKPAFLTYNHLSDSREHSALLKAHFAGCEGKELKTSVVVINTEPKVVCVSRKNSLIRAAIDRTMLTNKSNLVVDSQWLGWVTRKESFGVFVELPNGVSGLVSNKNICDQKPIGGEPQDLLEIGDTVEVKVIEYDTTKPKKGFFTMNMSKTYRAKEHLEKGGLEFLANHLEERKFIKSQSCLNVANLEIGCIVEAKVTSQLDWGFTVSVGDSVPGFVKNQHLPNIPLTVGSVHTSLIVDIDLGQSSVEVCMTGSILNAVTNLKNNSQGQVQVKQVIKSDVLAYNSDYVVAMLLDHGHGNIVYIPTKRFWNDIAKEFCWVVNQRNPTVIKRALTSNTFIGSLQINEPINNEGSIKTSKPKIEAQLVPTFRTIPRKIRLTVGQQYPVFFLSVKKNKIFFSISKNQKCYCNRIEYSDSLDELEQLLINPPSVNSLIERRITITDTGRKENGLASGHFLKKEVIEKGDEYCCKVLSTVKNRECVVELPFNNRGTIDLVNNEKSKVKIVPKKDSLIQCQVDDIVVTNQSSKISMSIAKISNYVEETEINSGEQTTTDKEVELMEVDKDNKVENNAKKVAKRKIREYIGSVPEIILSSKSEIQASECLETVFKRVHQSDDEDLTKDNTEEDEDNSSSAKKLKLSKQSKAERELNIREAEQRRESGDLVKNPQTETEFELLVFNYPTIADSWTKYMDFALADGQGVDKARSIAERAISVLSDRDTDTRFKVMLKYLDLEIDEITKLNDQDDTEKEMKKFTALFERCLTQKMKACYVHVCQRTRALKLYDLSENIAKRFVKDFATEAFSWFQLVAVRFEQKKFSVVKETLTNAERILKADQYRELQFKLGKLELEIGTKIRGQQILETLMASRPKDMSMKGKCEAILAKAGIDRQNEQSDSEMEG